MGQGYGSIFERFEKKYLLTEEQHTKLLARIDGYIEPDLFPHSKISNIYYDTEDNELIRRSVEKPCYKEKLRLRTYGTVVMLTLREARAYLDDGKKPDAHGQILDEIDYFLNWYKPVPRLFLSYERDSFRGREEQELRITFDTNIQSRRDELKLEKNLSGQVLLEENTWIMEIKVPQAYPIWLTRTLSDLSIYPVSFSKYGTVYRKEFTREEEKELCFQV